MALLTGTATLFHERYDATYTRLDGGGWVVNYYMDDGSGGGIGQSAFNKDGSLLSAYDQVNTNVELTQSGMPVAIDGGGWAVVWTNARYSQGFGLSQQLYNADGTPNGGETSLLAGSQRLVAVSTLDGGGYVINWREYGDIGQALHQQVFTSDGTAIGDGAVFSSEFGDFNLIPTITTLDNGGWVSVWSNNLVGTQNTEIYQRAFDASGAPLGPETLVNTITQFAQDTPKTTALIGGGWVVSYASDTREYSEPHIMFQAFNAAGEKVGSETIVTDGAYRYDVASNIAALTNGGWAIAWSDVRYGSDVFMKIYDETGVSEQGQIRVHSETTMDQVAPELHVTESGVIVVAWIASTPSGREVHQALFGADGTQIGDELTVSVPSAALRNFHIVPSTPNEWTITWSIEGYSGSEGSFKRDFVFDPEDPTGSPSGTFIAGKEDTPYVGDLDTLLQGLSDPDGGKLTIDTLSSDHGTVTIDFAAGTFTLIPEANYFGPVNLTYSVADNNGGLKESITLTLQLADVYDAPPIPPPTSNGAPFVGSPIVDQTAQPDTAFTFTIPAGTFSDPDGNNLNFTVEGLPTWLQFDPQTRTFVGSPGAGDAGKYDIVVTANDGSASVSDTFSVIVSNPIQPEDPRGTRRDDTLVGNEFDNILDGKRGNDTLSGGDGADTFVFGKKSGRDVITDFDPDEGDMIDFSNAVGVDSFRDLIKRHAVEVGDHIKITTADGSVVIIRNFEIEDLSSDMFVF